ncbi:MAG: 30S ribosomal protein S7 [Gammaproteobacteria bacterium]
MSRKHSNFTREILPDPKFGSEVIARFINMVMQSGKKSVAERIVYGAIDTIEERNKSASPVELIEQALDNVSPMVEVKSRRVGGATYQVPIEVRPKRRQTLAMRWIIEAARRRSEKNMPERLAGELLEAMEQRGAAVKKREDVHRMAEANKAFSHYRW